MIKTSNYLHCTCYLDGKTSQCGYRFTITNEIANGFAAFRTVAGLKYFIKNYGLKVDADSAKINDLRYCGHGRNISFAFEPRQITERYFWSSKDIPTNTDAFIGLENGSYVTLYALRDTDKTIIYRPNPNAKEVYRPFDYRVMQKAIG